MAAQDLFGNVDKVVTGEAIYGWVSDPLSPSTFEGHVRLHIAKNHVRTVRPDLKRGDGYVGFRIPCDDVGLPFLMLSGAVEIFAKSDDGRSTILPLHIPMLSDLRRSIFENGSTSDLDLSDLSFIAGSTSQDHSTLIGLEGFLFLFKGNNNVAEAYSRKSEDKSLNEDATAWVELISNRAASCMETCRARFLQLVVPEKSTILTRFAPRALGPVTPLMHELEKSISAEACRENYLSLISSLRALQSPPPYQRTDSHFSIEGAKATTTVILGRLTEIMPELSAQIVAGQSLVEQTVSTEKYDAFSGDLASKVFHIPLYERTPTYSFPEPFTRANVREVFRQLPPNGEHNGSYYQWENSAAPVDATVLIFGNSFFERGSSPRGLSWWFARLFKKVHFVWSAKLDEVLVGTVRPDLVICQSVERFLRVLPPT